MNMNEKNQLILTYTVNHNLVDNSVDNELRTLPEPYKTYRSSI